MRLHQERKARHLLERLKLDEVGTGMKSLKNAGKVEVR